MADVNISKYTTQVVREGSKPASPGFVVSEGQDPVNPPGTNNYVPYSGATANVELGEFGLEAGFVTLDTTPTNTPTDQGTLYWDDSRSTAALIMNGTLQHIGQDTFFYVKNSTGSSIAKGTAVRFDGTDGGSGHLLIAPFLADGTYPSTYFMGVTAEEIGNGEFGQVMHFGELSGINTSGFTAGALLYASTTVAGGFQTTAPVAPNNIVLIAAAVNSKNNGAIIVRPTYGSNINTDEGVKITSGTTGDLLQLQAGGLWENKTLAQVIGSAYVPSTRTITINGTTQDLSTNRTFNVGDMLLNTYQAVTGTKVFDPSRLIMAGEGTAQPTNLSNTQVSIAALTGHNSFGFNDSNNIYFNKGTTANGGIFTFSNSATRTYTLKDASGTLAFTSDIPANPVGGTGTTNYLPKFTGASTIGNSQVFDNGTNVGIGTASPNAKLDIGSGDIYVRTGLIAVNTIDSYNQTLTIRSNGNTAIFIPNTQNVLVGTTTDAGFKLDINGTGRFSGALIVNQDSTVYSSQFTLSYNPSSNNGPIILDNRNLFAANIGAAQWFGARFNSSGNYRPFGGIGAFKENGTDGNSLGYLSLWTNGNAADSTERMRITSGGYTKASNNGAYVNSTGAFHETNQDLNSGQIAVMRHSGNSNPIGLEIAFTGADPNNASNYMLGAYTTSGGFTWIYRIFSNGTVSARSDARWKKNIETTRSGYIDDLCKLRVVKYNWYNHQDDAPKELGLIAQEVEEVFPNLIQHDPVICKKQVEQKDGTFVEEEYQDGTSRSIKVSVLPYMLLKAIQEQQKQIEELKSKLL